MDIEINIDTTTPGIKLIYHLLEVPNLFHELNKKDLCRYVLSYHPDWVDYAVLSIGKAFYCEPMVLKSNVTRYIVKSLFHFICFHSILIKQGA